MVTPTLSQILRILPVPALELHIEGDTVFVVDANLPCRLRFPQIPSAGSILPVGFFRQQTTEELRRTIRAGGIAQLESDVAMGNGCVMHVAHCGNATAMVVFHERSEPQLLVSQEPLLHRVLEQVNEWILWVGPENQLVYTSPSVFGLTGYSAEEIMNGDSLLERLIHEEDRSLFFHHKHEAIGDQRPSQLQFRIRHRDGTVRWIMHVCHPVHEKDGTFRGIVSSNRDITAHKRSEELLRLMQFSMEHTQDAVFWLRRDSSFFYVNNAACRLLGYSQVELLEMKAGDLNPEHDGEAWERYWRELRENTAEHFEARLLRADGSLVPVEISANFLWFEGREFNCSFVRDITERKLHERTLIESRERLSQAMRFGKMRSFEYDVETGRLIFSDEPPLHPGGGTSGCSEEESGTPADMVLPGQSEPFREAIDELVTAQDVGLERNILLQFRDSQGDLRWMNTRLRLRPEGIPHARVVIGVAQDVTELRSTEDAIRAILHATNATGERFFHSLVKELCATLDVQYAFVSEMLVAEEPEARTIAFCSRNASIENIQFHLRDTPCEGLLADRVVTCLSGAQSRYPMDAFLPRYGAESYIGVRFTDQHGRMIGILGVMDTRPMRNSELSTQILRVMADRAAAELLRIQSEIASDELSRQFQQVFHASMDGMCVTDDERPILVNAAALRMFGYDSSDAIKRRTVFDFFHPDEHARIREYRSRDASGKRRVSAYETIGMRRDGSTFDVEMRVSEYVLGGQTYNFIILRDISERKRAQAELIAAKERAEQSERLKDAFIATVSHEIRTPLNIISGYTELLREVFAPHTDAETAEYFDSVHAGARRLERTVDLILNISRIQTGDTRLNPVPLHLGQFLRTRVEDFRRIIEAKGIELRFEGEHDVPQLHLDEYCMAQAIDNLLDNAGKFTHHGWIAVRLRGPENNEVTIEIEDTGIGISAEYLPHLFERYSQEEVGYGRKYEGIGLGLTLVQEYMRLNGGNVSVRSVKGQGTTFTLHLPLSQAHVL